MGAWFYIQLAREAVRTPGPRLLRNWLLPVTRHVITKKVCGLGWNDICYRKKFLSTGFKMCWRPLKLHKTQHNNRLLTDGLMGFIVCLSIIFPHIIPNRKRKHIYSSADNAVGVLPKLSGVQNSCFLVRQSQLNQFWEELCEGSLL